MFASYPSSCRRPWCHFFVPSALPLGLALGLTFGLASSEARAAHAETLAGQASVIDGDTLDIHGDRVRFFGIDAPESSQTCKKTEGKTYRCGQVAGNALDKKIASRPVRCESKSRDPYGRAIAVCFVGKLDLNRWMVSQGHAIAYRRYSTDYVGAEETAKAAHKGIWAGTFQEPYLYRKAARQAEHSGNHDGNHDGNHKFGQKNWKRKAFKPQKVPDRCHGKPPIKGNISKRGKHIYHMPGSDYYEKTRIDESAGEKYFCSEAAAKKAGFKHAGIPKKH